MLALNVTQRTEDYGSSLTTNKAERQLQEKRKIDTVSYWLMNAFLFPFPTPFHPNLEKPPDKTMSSECKLGPIFGTAKMLIHYMYVTSKGRCSANTTSPAVKQPLRGR